MCNINGNIMSSLGVYFVQAWLSKISKKISNINKSQGFDLSVQTYLKLIEAEWCI